MLKTIQTQRSSVDLHYNYVLWLFKKQTRLLGIMHKLQYEHIVAFSVTLLLRYFDFCDFPIFLWFPFFKGLTLWCSESEGWVCLHSPK